MTSIAQAAEKLHRVLLTQGFPGVEILEKQFLRLWVQRLEQDFFKHLGLLAVGLQESSVAPLKVQKDLGRHRILRKLDKERGQAMKKVGEIPQNRGVLFLGKDQEERLGWF